MRQRTAIAVILLVAALLLSACAAPVRQAAEFAVAREAAYDSAPMFEGEMDKAFSPESPRAAVGGTQAAYSGVEGRMIIRRTSMSILVEDTDVMLERLQQIVTQHGGYVSELNRWLSNEQPYANVTLRIPAENLEEALGSVREGAIRVDNETSSGDDVTEEYTDLSARLRNLEATETELLALLTEVRQNRGRAEDILAIHNRITEIRGQIESLKGRVQYLERMTALATIRIEIRPRTQTGTIIQTATWNPLVTAGNALRALVQVLQELVNLAIWVVVFSLLLVPPALVLWAIVRTVRRRRRLA
jgi:hypothetical protein